MTDKKFIGVHGERGPIVERGSAKHRLDQLTMSHSHTPTPPSLWHRLLVWIGVRPSSQFFTSGGTVPGDFSYSFPNHAIIPPGPLVFDDSELMLPESLRVVEPFDVMDPTKEHFEVEVRGVAMYVTGYTIRPSRSAGIYQTFFEPDALYNRAGHRLKALEQDLTDDEWNLISEQVEPELDE